MIDLETLGQLQDELKTRIDEDGKLLDEMREEVRKLRSETRRIQPRSAKMISIVGTDEGNTRLTFDPFQIQVIRVVDSNRKHYGLEVITPHTSIAELTVKHVRGTKTPLGAMMAYLGLSDLSELSPVFKANSDGKLADSWISVYREMMQWAVLFHLVRDKDYANDTVILCNGLLRSKVFAKKSGATGSEGLFGKFREGLEEGIRRQFEENKRRLYICGIAKRSSVFLAYRVAMALEGVMRNTYPCFLEVPRSMEERVITWHEYITRTDMFAAGKMFFVKFGSGTHDPIWAVDLLISQQGEAQTIFGYLLDDAKEGFPISQYPYSLQRAQDSAVLEDFDLEILQDRMCEALRQNIGGNRAILDELILQDSSSGMGLSR
jgi:hypothetical protein